MRHLATLFLFSGLLLTVGGQSPPPRAPGSGVETIPLPPLRIDGSPAKAHTQGMEVVSHDFYITARRDDVSPRRPLLLRTRLGRTDWDSWDIAAESPPGLDHPGGMQSDGTRLWIPVAGRRGGRTVIRAFAIAALIPGEKPKPEVEFGVVDHIGALAISGDTLLGATWDTERVMMWETSGGLKKSLSGAELARLGLGMSTGSSARSGIAVQDWKFVGDRLFASGVHKTPGKTAAPPVSRLGLFSEFLTRPAPGTIMAIPEQAGVELGREAMAVSGEFLYFLPEDLGGTNRVYKINLERLRTFEMPLKE